MKIGLHGIEAKIEYQREMMEWLIKRRNCRGLNCGVGYVHDEDETECPLSRNGNSCGLAIEHRVRAATEWLERN